ncbi:MAG: quinolinate synthase NadA [Pseudomonadota bacterium]
MKNETIKQKISELKKIKNAAILAHHYAPEEVHEIADVLSDSRGFFEAVKGGIDAHLLIIVAPTFFADITAAMLPDKTVMVPIHSECPVANHPALSFEKIAEFKEKHHDTPFVCYATSPLKTQLLADFICVQGQMVQTIESVENPKVLFSSEPNCAIDALQQTTKQIIKYPVCNIYKSANASEVYYSRQQHPESKVLVHPEWKVLGTEMGFSEMGFWERVKNEFPAKENIQLTPFLRCNVFKVFHLKTILDALEDRGTTIRVDQIVANKVAALFNQTPEKFGIAASYLRNPRSYAA